jgi:cyclopropane fatty-acyl-phospholipid synthase-like methyltransferase
MSVETPASGGATIPPPPLAPPACDDRRIWDLWLGFYQLPTVAVADALGVFAAVAQGPSTNEELARRLGLQPRETEAMTGVLVSLDLLARLEGRLYLTPLSREYLLPGGPYYWGGFMERVRATPVSCAALVEALRRGSAGDRGHASTLWEAPEPDAARLQAFTRAMHSHSFALAMSAVDRLGLKDARRMLDAGGGSGSFSIAAALRHPALRCTVMDLAPVCEVAMEYAARYGVEHRVETRSVDMFSGTWPREHDTVFFNDIFHDWDTDRCLRLARSSHDALPSGGRILVHEMLLSDDGDGPLPAAVYSMAMVFATRGKQRSAAELRAILEEAGFVDVALLPTAGYYSLVSGRKE